MKKLISCISYLFRNKNLSLKGLTDDIEYLYFRTDIKPHQEFKDDIQFKLLLESFYNKRYTNSATYYDKNYTSIHCEAGKIRSLGDWIIICKTYFNNLSERDIIIKLYSTVFKTHGEKKVLNIGYCNDIKKIMCLRTRTSDIVSNVNDRYITYKNKKTI